MKNALIKRFGATNVSDIQSETGAVSLSLINIPERNVQILVTNTLHEYRMPVPEKEAGFEYNELYFCLPSYWEIEERDNPRMNWVFHWIERLTLFVQEKETWFGHGHTMPCGKEEKPLSDTMQQNFFMLSRPMLLEQELRPIEVDGKTVHFLAIIPLFENEFMYKYGKGTRKLTDRMSAKRVDEKLDDFRESVMKSRLQFWR